MKKLLGILVLGLLWCNISFSKEIFGKGFVEGMASDNEIIHRYIKGNLSGIYSGFMYMTVKFKLEHYCVPDNLAINSENLVRFVEDEIKFAKKIDYYDGTAPISFYLMDHLKRTFPCP